MASPSQEKFVLEKPIWTDADYDKMGWHDVIIHGFSFDRPRYEVLFDIDYMFDWVNPEPPSPYYSFWISPVTLVFHNTYGLKADINHGLGLQIMDIIRSKDPVPQENAYIKINKQWEWTLELDGSKISFHASGFTQFTCSLPRHWKKSQSFTLEERGGISFDRPEKSKEISQLITR